MADHVFRPRGHITPTVPHCVFSSVISPSGVQGNSKTIVLMSLKPDIYLFFLELCSLHIPQKCKHMVDNNTMKTYLSNRQLKMMVISTTDFLLIPSCYQLITDFSLTHNCYHILGYFRQFSLKYFAFSNNLSYMQNRFYHYCHAWHATYIL